MSETGAAEINEITTNNFNALPINIEVLDKAATNKVFKVELPELIVVVRLSPESNTDQFKKEKWELEQASQRQIISPKVLAVGMQNETPYMVMEYINGTHGSDSEDTNRIWRKLGNYAKIIHQIPIEGFGENMVTSGKFSSNRNSFAEYVQYNLDCLNAEDRLLQMGILTQAQSEKLRELFENLKKGLFEFGLNHGDLALRNTIISKSGLISLFDWGSSEVHIIPHFDIVEVLQTSFKFDSKHQDFIAFLAGYGLSRDQFLEIKPTIDTLFILRAIDKLRWALDKNPAKLEDFKDNVAKVLNYLDI